MVEFLSLWCGWKMEELLSTGVVTKLSQIFEKP